VWWFSVRVCLRTLTPIPSGHPTVSACSPLVVQWVSGTRLGSGVRPSSVSFRSDSRRSILADALYTRRHFTEPRAFSRGTELTFMLDVLDTGDRFLRARRRASRTASFTPSERRGLAQVQNRSSNGITIPVTGIGWLRRCRRSE
jgi:hypothetical protein